MTARPRGADQSGFALTLVLGVIMLTSAAIIALLGYGITSARIADRQATDARELRAADGALEGAVASLARSAGPNPCAGVPSGATVSFDSGSPDLDDDVVVTLQCGPATGSAEPDAPLGGPDVKLVGDSAFPGGPAPATLRSTGTAPLLFDADVTVRGGASVQGAANGPAVSAAGQYVQGLAGPNASAGSPCGDLAAAGSAARIADRNGSPTCDEAAARTITADAEELVAAADSTLPLAAVPAACPTAPVVQLEPGRYGGAQLRSLNGLLDGTCAKTFWFKPGIHVFDSNAVDPADPTSRLAPALVVNDPQARVVFGAPSGWDPAVGATAAAFPQACDPSASGASIQLSGRTAIRHIRGRMAICPRILNGVALPAITQVPSAPRAPVTTWASSTQFTVPGGGNGGTALLAAPNDASQSANATFVCTVQWWEPDCVPERSFQARFSNVDPALLQSARVVVASQETPKAPAASVSRSVQLAVAGPTINCSTGPQRAGRTHWQLASYELLAGGCDAALRGQPGTVLDDATVTVTFQVSGLACTVDFTWGKTCGGGWEPHTLGLRGVRLVANPPLATSTGPVTTSSQGWVGAQGADAVLADDGLFAQVPQDGCPFLGSLPCAPEVPGFNRSLTVGGLRFAAGGPIGGTNRVATLHAVVKNRPPGAATVWVSDPVDDSWTTFRLRTTAGTCTVRYPGYSQSDQATWFDLLGGGGGSDCAAVVPDAASLVDAELTVTMESGCSWAGSSRLTPGPDGRCGTVRLPELQYVTLAATTDAVLSPPPVSEVRVDATPTGAGTTFHVDGRTVMPRSDLRIRWQGAAPSLPLFGGFLTLNGLASQMDTGASMGVVCCSSTTGAVRIDALVGGEVRAQAGVLVGPPRAGGGPRDVTTLDWRLCGSTCVPSTAPGGLAAPVAEPPDG
jgi:hypothetical protein